MAAVSDAVQQQIQAQLQMLDLPLLRQGERLDLELQIDGQIYLVPLVRADAQDTAQSQEVPGPSSQEVPSNASSCLETQSASFEQEPDVEGTVTYHVVLLYDNLKLYDTYDLCSCRGKVAKSVR